MILNPEIGQELHGILTTEDTRITGSFGGVDLQINVNLGTVVELAD
jgi:hypothetical protein